MEEEKDVEVEVREGVFSKNNLFLNPRFQNILLRCFVFPLGFLPKRSPFYVAWLTGSEIQKKLGGPFVLETGRLGLLLLN